jgi:hypothetical protein
MVYISCMTEKRPDSVISFKVPEVASGRLLEVAKRLSNPSISWRGSMSRHQAARAIVLAALGAPGFEPILKELKLRREE